MQTKTENTSTHAKQKTENTSTHAKQKTENTSTHAKQKPKTLANPSQNTDLIRTRPVAEGGPDD